MFEFAFALDMILQMFLFKLRDFVVLQLDVCRFLSVFSRQKEIVVFYFFENVGQCAFDLIDFDGILSLFFVKGLQQFTHNLSDLGFNLVPLKLSHLESLFLILVLASHNFIMERVIIDDKGF